MTIETQTELFRTPEPRHRVPNARRQGETLHPTVPEAVETADEIIFPSISSPPIWPRVFPGI